MMVTLPFHIAPGRVQTLGGHPVALDIAFTSFANDIGVKAKVMPTSVAVFSLPAFLPIRIP